MIGFGCGIMDGLLKKREEGKVMSRRRPWRGCGWRAAKEEAAAAAAEKTRPITDSRVITDVGRSVASFLGKTDRETENDPSLCSVPLSLLDH